MTARDLDEKCYAQMRLGTQLVRLDFDTRYNAIRPKAGNETWLLQVKLTFLFPE